MNKVSTIVMSMLALWGLVYGVLKYEEHQAEQRNREIVIYTEDETIWTTVGCAETVYNLNLDEESWEFEDWTAE